MCGILGILQLQQTLDREKLGRYTDTLAQIIAHRGPDSRGIWIDENAKIGLAHNRLSIIDLSEEANQPMVTDSGLVIVFNGEIYNYIELRKELQSKWTFKSNSDTEVILALYSIYGEDCLEHLRGMFAFAIWDTKNQTLFCARDRFGIKPFYYIHNDKFFAFASEAKALLPLLDSIKTHEEALLEYYMFQYTIGSNTLFDGVIQLLPGEKLTIKNNSLIKSKYWVLEYQPDFYHSEKYFYERFEEVVTESIKLHLRSDVPVACYLSGGIDSSVVSALSSQHADIAGFYHGRFDLPNYDESNYARALTDSINKQVDITDITSADFVNNINKIIYHLDFPVAGPGSFPQFMVSKKASESVKVILGGQGGDELFGGYARYLIAYFEQAINAAIEDTHKNGNFVVTPESIIPNLKTLKEYKPLIKQFWKDGLFESLDKRYLRLINRMIDFNEEVHIDKNAMQFIEGRFSEIFNAPNTAKASYFDKMTHFDLSCLLPALLQVEDRVSMANGLESRVPFLDHKLAEFVANIPADIKFKGGAMKHILKNTFGKVLPSELLNRRDKMGFPVPLNEWFKGELKDFVVDTFSQESPSCNIFNRAKILQSISDGQFAFSRKIWGLLSLDLWYKNFHDKEYHLKNLLSKL